VRSFFFPAKLADVPTQTADVLAALGPRFDRPLVRAAVSEALLNAVLYGTLGLGAKGGERDIDELLDLAHEAEANLPDGAGIHVEIAPTDGGLVVRVRDRGNGFDWRAALARLADASENATVATRGRGVALMRSAAGVTWNDRGNEVSLLFPFPADGATPPPPRPPRPSSPSTANPPTPCAAGSRGGRVLIVDDVAFNCTLLAHALKAAGFHVETATSGAGALAAIIDWQPDLLLLDLHMPGMDGIAVLQRMAELDLIDRVPVLVMTAGEADAELRSIAIELGANDFLGKGIAHRELVARIRRSLSMRRNLDTLSDERDQLRRSIDAASQLMRSLLPEPRVTCGPVVISSLVIPSAQIGGDVVDLVRISPGRWAALLLDVAGHGLRAALTASASRTLLRERLEATRSIALAASALHRVLLQDAELTHHHAALAAVVIDENDATLELLNAGSPPLALWMRDGSLRTFPSRSPPIGLLDECEFDTTLFNLHDVLRVVLVSDGITEPFASPKDTLGALTACCGPIGASPLEELPRSAIEASIARLGDDRDDASLVWLELAAHAPSAEREEP
jgi:CheY-like chemotaxis protein